MDQQTFLTQAMIFLAAAVIMVPIAKRLGLGSVLGYLLAGIIIGPAVLGLIHNDSGDIMHAAEFGVVMMLFLIGLELEPALLWRLRKSIIGLGGLQVLLSAVIIAGISFGLGLPWQQAVALGLILSLSSTAIVLQTLQEKGLMQQPVGRHSFSVLLFQDIAVIPMLALFPLLQNLPLGDATGDEHSTLVDGLPAWLQTLVVLGSVALIIGAGRFVVRPLLRLVAKTRQREVFTATALLLVIGIAVLMMQVGLSPALGTFLAGVVLANSEYRHELESDLEPFKGLLLGLFFIAVGASINFTLVAAQPLIIGGLVLGVMAAKAVVLYLLGRSAKLSLNDRFLFAFGLSQVGEFAFVLLTFTNQHGILPQELTSLMVAVVALSMALTPLALLVHEHLLAKRLQPANASARQQDDAIDEHNQVIIAGFGHFGNTVGRFLRAHKIGLTILDNDADRVELLRRMGFKVYYGDASRHELLAAAGAESAKLIIICLEPSEKRLELIETIKKHFPNLRMLVRASNRYDAYDLMNAGMLHIYRETMDTSLRVGVDAMRFLGFRAYTAQRAASLFFKKDEANLRKLSAIRDEEEYILSAREKIEELEKLLQTDMVQNMQDIERGWDEESLIDAAHRASDATVQP
ncbi:Kef-type potassium/proton antiporter, CPA2 family [Cnuella takakiae]|uniref:Kef-type potassium/proton antiporter, CPA2 family n=1 Tax=Cnuella takakiae TaxID=1302690 RepID=A0A1M5HF58_9BACT|nr:monovalent cation:proton antiporter-2 (CPA2) family protein [Cnuella takakiae]OLY92850.1 potassium transporter [Cnuella takakiae]SHG14584.1 Kef-type potassium/proton antiporter, CPA2 family [Cnuella takakiae]